MLIRYIRNAEDQHVGKVVFQKWPDASDLAWDRLSIEFTNQPPTVVKMLNGPADKEAMATEIIRLMTGQPHQLHERP